MLALSRKIGEKINLYIGSIKIEVDVVELKNGKVKLGFTAPPEVKIAREEIDARAKMLAAVRKEKP